MTPPSRPFPRVTIYEVAKHANVSISTVSKALNRPERVSESTRLRVLAAADELGFTPSQQAVSLARRGTGRIGVMAPFTAYGSYLRRLSGVLSEARRRDIDVVVFDHESAALASSPVLATMPIHGRLDGLIVMGLEIEPSIAERFYQRGLRCVAVDANSTLFSSIVVDDVMGGRLAAEHLAARGHSRVGYLLEHQVSDYESQAILRLNGFRAAFTKGNGATVEVAASANSPSAARAVAGAMLDGPDRPTAIMAHHDQLAVGALLAARDRGLRIPEDVAIMGFDDGEAAVACDLTTVRQPFEESGRIAVSILLGQATAAGQRSTTLLDVEVVPRSTT